MADRGAPPDGGASAVDRPAVARRTRNIAAWAIAFFIAAVPVAILGGGISPHTEGAASTGGVIAMVFWLLGVLTGGWSFALAFRHWDKLPLAIRWLAALPLLVVLFLLAATAIVTVLT